MRFTDGLACITTSGNPSPCVSLAIIDGWSATGVVCGAGAGLGLALSGEVLGCDEAGDAVRRRLEPNSSFRCLGSDPALLTACCSVFFGRPGPRDDIIDESASRAPAFGR